ncbi:MAG: 6-phosphogluconolactonase [Mariprofundus sp.]|nr:6-phosphogluconolactonase [Mariprofundus sp.]
MLENLIHHENNDAVAHAVARRIIEAASSAIAARGAFHLALAGGTTPRCCYALLRDADIDWNKLHIWFGDERCLPVGDSERNDLMADQALLNYVNIPSHHIHRMAAELGPDQAASMYTEELATIPCLDLVLCGMGEDGHTCSLFPNNPALADDRPVVPVFNAPKPPPERVSLGYSTLHAAHERIIMVTGEGKRDVFERIRLGESFPVMIANSEWHSTL